MSVSRKSLESLGREQKRLLQQVNETKSEPADASDPVPTNPVEFAGKWLGFEPKAYQADLLRDGSKRIVVIYPRQSGKTTTLAVRMIWYASAHPNTTSLIVTPGLRQSMIVMDRVHQYLMRISKPRRRRILAKMQRTVVRFKNGAQIVALPNAPDLLRGYSASNVVADEAAFFREDELVFYSVLFPMLQTTDGSLIVSSTPWDKGSVFYKFAQESDFSKHRIGVGEVIKAGLTTEKFIDEMKRRTPIERFRREYLGEFVEDELSYYSQKLVTQCIDSGLSAVTDDWTKTVRAPVGRYFLGVDLGKKVDHSVIAVFRWNTKEKRAELVGMVWFELETPYPTVIGMVKLICDKLQRVEKVLVDRTGVGEYITDDMKAAGIRSTIEGVNFTVQSKQEILGYLKNLMDTRAVCYYFDPDLIAEINVERYELTKNGQILFSHPEGSHDDRLSALALAVYATRTQDTSYMGKAYGVPHNW